MHPRPIFTPFHEEKAIVVYRRNLPHWRQENATYFITFRLADSLPRRLLEQWDDEKREWLAVHGIEYDPKSAAWRAEFQSKLSPKEQFEFRQVFNRKLNEELDRGGGSCVFRSDPCLTILRSHMFEGDTINYHLGDFVIMPNHVHVLLNLVAGIELAKALQRIKGGSAFLCNQALGRSGKLWQKESYDHLVRDSKELRSFRKYIQSNPKKARIQVPQEGLYEAAWLVPAPPES